MPRKKKEKEISVPVMNVKEDKERKAKTKKTSSRVSRKKKEDDVGVKIEVSEEGNKPFVPILWRAAEYEHGEKSITWQVSVIGATLLIALIGFWMDNFFFGVFILFAGGLLFFFSRRRPEIFDFEVSENGIEVKERITLPFEKIKSFSMRKRPGMLNELIIRKDVTVNPYLKIPIDDKTGERVVEVLRNRVSEVEYEESIIDLVSDWLGL